MTSVDDFVDRVRRITGFDDLGVGTEPLPFAHALSPAGLTELLGHIEPTPLDDAIAETARIVAAAESADEAADRRELATARADDDYVPWDEVKAALRLE